MQIWINLIRDFGGYLLIKYYLFAISKIYTDFALLSYLFSIYENKKNSKYFAINSCKYLRVNFGRKCILLYINYLSLCISSMTRCLLSSDIRLYKSRTLKFLIYMIYLPKMSKWGILIV